jgi:trk system potassium uptake protein TrkH
MISRFFKSFFDRLSLLSAAEATVISFVIMSLIGGSLLWFTEKDRMVNAKVPSYEEVHVLMTNPTDPSDPRADRKEVHTFINDVSYKGEKFIDTLFTAVSALCVTGLTSTDFSEFTLAGQIITMILIQMGGLGIIMFTSIFAFAIVRGLSEHQNFKSIMSGILDTEHHYVGHMIKRVIIYTLIIETGAFLIMGAYLQWFVDPSIINNLNPWWWSLFHSVSAFNNAGFGLLNNNLVNFVTDPVISLTISTLIILGGLGYPVLIAAHTYFRKKLVRKNDTEQRELEDAEKGVVASPVQTRVAIIGTILLLAIGTILPLITDRHNPILQNYSGPQKVLIMFFQSVSTRTAGFNTIDIGALGIATVFLYIILMVIGANPAGTAGGMKIPTVAVLYGYTKDWFKKPGEPVTLFKHRVSKFALSHAIRLFFFSIIFIVGITFAITTIEGKWLYTPDPNMNFIKTFFEITSAFGTVGLSMGFSGSVTSLSAIFHPISKFLIIVTMLFGRLGPLTVLAALPWKKRYADHPPSPDFEDAEKIQIG